MLSVELGGPQSPLDMKPDTATLLGGNFSPNGGPNSPKYVLSCNHAKLCIGQPFLFFFILNLILVLSAWVTAVCSGTLLTIKWHPILPIILWVDPSIYVQFVATGPAENTMESTGKNWRFYSSFDGNFSYLIKLIVKDPVLTIILKNCQFYFFTQIFSIHPQVYRNYFKRFRDALSVLRSAHMRHLLLAKFTERKNELELTKWRPQTLPFWFFFYKLLLARKVRWYLLINKRFFWR